MLNKLHLKNFHLAQSLNVFSSRVGSMTRPNFFVAKAKPVDLDRSITFFGRGGGGGGKWFSYVWFGWLT